MRTLKVTSLLTIVLLPLCASHFIILTPPPLGNNINNEDQSPCGGFSPSSSDNITDFHVGGDAVGLTSLHAQSYFAYRALLGTSLSAPNWTVLIPTVEEFGLNSFCQPALTIPPSWVGSAGLLQVVQDAEDGVHYQCMHVNFVAGTGTPQSACSNSSGVSAQYADDPTFDTMEGNGSSASPTPSSSQPSSSATQAASPSVSSAASPTMRSMVAAAGLLAGVLAALFAA
ncbi:expression library immunization antigen 1 [Fonsecaea pedrosoi]|nr:expression library immunization antigen 1 [Fonsecaea pedrosoi]